MTVCRVRVPIVVEVTTFVDDPSEALPRAPASLYEQIGRMRRLADTEHLDPEEGDEVRAWAHTAGIRVEHMTALDGCAGDDATCDAEGVRPGSRRLP